MEVSDVIAKRVTGSTCGGVEEEMFHLEIDTLTTAPFSSFSLSLVFIGKKLELGVVDLQANVVPIVPVT